MKVIFVTDLDLWSMGNRKGGEAFFRTVTKYQEAGDEVFLISDVEPNKNITWLDNTHNILVKPSVFKRWVLTRKIGLFFRFADHKIAGRKIIKELRKVINLVGKDKMILYAYEIFGVEACKRTSQKYGIPFVSRFQGTILTDIPYNVINILRRYPHYQALRTKSDLVIMTDDGTKGDKVLETVGNNSNYLFLKNGLELREEAVFEKVEQIDRNTTRTEIGVDKDEIMFLTVSRLTGWKRVDRAIEGFAAFVKLGGIGKLVIVGDGDQRVALQSLADEMGIGNRVVFVGAVKHEEVYKYMVAADVFLSLFDLSNVGNPLLEAMTIGKCIVTLNVGDTGSVVNNDNGILMSKDNICSLGNIMFDLGKKDDVRKKFGDNARSYAVEHFYTWEKRLSIEYQEVSKLLAD